MLKWVDELWSRALVLDYELLVIQYRLDVVMTKINVNETTSMVVDWCWSMEMKREQWCCDEL
jgi:hypothetical protein